jgi:hypothetical protein
LFKRAFEVGANHVQIIPQADTLKAVFTNEKNEKDTEELAPEAYSFLHKFFTRDKTRTLHARRNNQPFVLTLESNDSPKHTDPILEMTIKSCD